jgi:hypothetical protein
MAGMASPSMILRDGSTGGGRSPEHAGDTAGERGVAARADARGDAGEAIAGDGSLAFLLDEGDELGRREHGTRLLGGVSGIDT